MSRPVVDISEDATGIRVRLAVGSAGVWLRATPGGRRLSVAVEEGRGEVEVEWSIRRLHPSRPVAVAGPWVQSPPPERPER